ncbi:hypothetical protein [uncultured Tateyamaria sp.]|uniref:hypothetical protein n=1 Tax=uncultured Tateyamaria sp. TaxID=455651 RepID=UPI00260D252C|nr:hypothetical protein [uncultured Tateyamaria sp.]
MGPLRGGLILTLLPGVAWAEVCDKVRPLWTPGTEASAWGEMIALMGTPFSLALLLMSAVAVRFRHEWGALVVVLLWTAWVSIIVFYGAGDEVQVLAAQEGCIGPPTLFIAAAAAICIGMILYVAPPFGRDRHSENE